MTGQRTCGPDGAWVPGNRWDLAPVGSRLPTVSVVITHYEQPGQLARSLAALAAQTHPGHLVQIIVADDGSSVVPEPPGVQVVTQPDAGFRAARIRNRAVAQAHGEVLLFLDADTVPEPGYVAAMARLPAALPEAVVVGRRRHADLARLPIEQLATANGLAAYGSRHELSTPGWLADAYERSADLLVADETSYRFVIGAVMGCSRWFFEETGGFDESFVTYGGEDWEWAHRAWTHGAVMAHVRSAVAWHDGPARGERPGWGADVVGRERLRHETVAIAARVPVPGVAPRALLGVAGDPLVTVAEGVEGDGLVLCVDSLLEAWPRARVLLDARRCAALPPDPRVVEHEREDVLSAEPAVSAWRHLHVMSAVTGGVEAWCTPAQLLAGPDAVGRVDVRARSGGLLVRWESLRARRRELRWADLPRAEPVQVVADLASVDSEITVQSRWGGWA